MSLYRRDDSRREQDRKHDVRKPCTCRFCGAANLVWGEVAPDRYRLHEQNGTVHDCPQFHDAKHNRNAPRPAVVERGSLLKRVNTWVQRWSLKIPADALDELDEILDDVARH